MKSMDHLAAQEIYTAAPVGESPKNGGTSFYRGDNCNFNPYGIDHVAKDFCNRFIMKGWEPDGALINADTKVTAFGSCFAHNISNHLASLGFNMSKDRAGEIYVSTMGEGLVNVHSILQQFKWSLDGWEPPTNLWHGYKAEEYDLKDEIRQKTREVFLTTDVFILTFGLSEIWYDEITGGVFWRAVPLANFDANRHKFRVCTFAETKAAIAEIVSIIHTHVPQAKIIMTVSPIPLAATFRPQSCITANSASKALIRAALDEVIREKTAGSELHYFPAFDMVTELFPHRYMNDGRHPHEMIVPAIMKTFEAYYCETALSMEEAEKALQDARVQDVGTLATHPLYAKGLPNVGNS